MEHNKISKKPLLGDLERPTFIDLLDLSGDKFDLTTEEEKNVDEDSN